MHTDEEQTWGMSVAYILTFAYFSERGRGSFTERACVWGGGDWDGGAIDGRESWVGGISGLTRT